MRHFSLAISFCVIVLAIAGCGSALAPLTPTPQPVVPTLPLSGDQIIAGPAGDTGKGGPAACPRLDATLYALSTASDPAAFAAAANIPYEQGRVLVYVTFDAPVDFDQYGATVTGQIDQLAQLLVPPNELCRLANDANVTAVRLPDMAAPARP